MRDLTIMSIRELTTLACILCLAHSFKDRQELQHVLAELRARGAL